jgi:vacuolar-type H+-ATPase catalytic subunit A/Vma1
VPNSLNYCKSNIAWLEATSVGAAIIAPDWEEWRKPGIIRYDSIEKYGELLLNYQSDNLHEHWAKSREYIMENLTLEKVNKQRVKLVERLMDNSPVSKFYMSNLPDTMIE